MVNILKKEYDETTDIPTTKQMVLAIRYFDSKCITEKFISVIECENISGESIANLIMDTLTKVELNLENLRVRWSKTYVWQSKMNVNYNSE